MDALQRKGGLRDEDWSIGRNVIVCAIKHLYTHVFFREMSLPSSYFR